MPTKAKLTCFCGAAFTTIDLFKKHVEKEGHRFKCSCGWLCKALLDINNHQRDKKHSPPTYYVEHPSLQSGGVQSPQVVVNDGPAKVACKLCNRTFKNVDGLGMHLVDRHPTCPTCEQAYANKEQLCGHQRAANHCYCPEHDLVFGTSAALHVHSRQGDHVTGFQCLPCDREFKTLQGLDHHLKDVNHPEPDNTADPTDAAAAKAKATVEEANLYCEACDRTFLHLGSFKQHKESVKHKPLSDMQCPLSTSCGKVFTSPSALLLHLESGYCKWGMNRVKLNAVIHQHDTARYITSEEHVSGVLSAVVGMASLELTMEDLSLASMETSGVLIITPNDNDDDDTVSMASLTSRLGGGFIRKPEDDDTASVSSSESGVIVNPIATTPHSRASSVMNDPTATSYAKPEWFHILDPNNTTPTPPLASDAIQTADTLAPDNSGAWPCTKCSKTFRKKDFLLQHLHSPVHTPQLFHCPVALVGKHTGAARKAFKTLSGLAQHIELGACGGGKEALDLIVGVFEDKIKAATGRDVKLLHART